MNKNVNAKALNIFPLSHQFVSNDIFPYMSIKHTKPLCGKVVSLYGPLDTFSVKNSPLLLSNDHCL